VLQGKTQIGKLSGDAEAGRQLFFGQAECGSCHMVHGVGGFIASDLTGYASGVGQGDILKAIVSQPQVIPENSEVVDLVTASGERLRGVRRSEDNFNLVVQLRSGRYRRFRKADLKKLTYTGHWLMPVDYGKRLTPRQLDDIVSYLARSSSTVDPSERRNKGGDE
jgi:putative heme-binding domain-containing protein